MAEKFEKNPMTDDAEMSFLLVKPHSVQAGADNEIRTILERNKFFIAGTRRIIVTPPVVNQLFSITTADEAFLADFSRGCTGMTVMFQVARKNAIQLLRKLCGVDNPAEATVGTLHYMYGVNEIFNGVYAPRSEKEFDHQLACLEVWFKVYMQALAEREENAVSWAEKQFEEIMSGIKKGKEETHENENVGFAGVDLATSGDPGVPAGE